MCIFAAFGSSQRGMVDDNAEKHKGASSSVHQRPNITDTTAASISGSMKS